MDEKSEKKKRGVINNSKRILLVFVLIAMGLLLILSRYNLITLSDNLVLYTGIGLLALAALYYVIY